MAGIAEAEVNRFLQGFSTGEPPDGAVVIDEETWLQWDQPPCPADEDGVHTYVKVSSACTGCGLLLGYSRSK
jgi:hypothetical protein